MERLENFFGKGDFDFEEVPEEEVPSFYREVLIDSNYHRNRLLPTVVRELYASFKEDESASSPNLLPFDRLTPPVTPEHVKCRAAVFSKVTSESNESSSDHSGNPEISSEAPQAIATDNLEEKQEQISSMRWYEYNEHAAAC
ncbi:unnamed protein product [Dracunculus medinensis]|uniref:RGS domain-containing protein n=1 Tax=Dracunculus medinensis TaxID=318479 RepID=A0A0N4UI61_DRAME|nr:unnamed protein product [Dracunculus medinensis]